MPNNESVSLNDRPRVPWNKGKLIGPQPPLRPKHVWSIRTQLMVEGRVRDLAMFNLAIDSKLRACDVVALNLWTPGAHAQTPRGLFRKTEMSDVGQKLPHRP
jgi:hypothetical protein